LKAGLVAEKQKLLNLCLEMEEMAVNKEQQPEIPPKDRSTLTQKRDRRRRKLCKDFPPNLRKMLLNPKPPTE
jgi:hypothetical protein